jgi:hypothetical protein
MQIIVTISPGNSGGGAIHDFIIKNTEYHSPLYGHEFRIMQDPNGVINLYNNFYKNFTINNCSNALFNFKRYIKKISKLKMFAENSQKRIYCNDIEEITNQYLKKIIKVEYSALPQFFKLNLTLLENILAKFGLRINPNNPNLFKMILPVNKNLFLIETKKYLKNICNNNFNKNKIILDQAISIWNFDEIFNFFDNVKIIIVTRDPRSVFYSMKSRNAGAFPGRNVNIFIKWYKDIFEKFLEKYKKSENKKNILLIKFENFIKNYSSEKKRVLNFISSKEINDNYDFSSTKKNLRKAEFFLSKKENKLIKDKLNKYLQW